MPDPTDTPDLVASTGVNDTSSPWYGDLLQSVLRTGVQVGGDALTRSLSTQTPITAPGSSAPGLSGSPPSPAAAVRMAPSASSMLPWLLGGVIVVVLGWIFLFRK